MPIDAVAALKSLSGLGRPAFRHLRQQWHRRSAEGQAAPRITVERELDEALGVLIGDAGTLGEFVAQSFKAIVSARPSTVKDDDVRGWLREPATRQLLKQAAIDLISGNDTAAAREEAGRLFLASAGRDAWLGQDVFDDAIAFLLLTLDAQLDTGDRLIVQMMNEGMRELHAGIHDALAAQVGDIVEALTPLADPHVPEALLSDYVLNRVRRAKRSRAISVPGRSEQIVHLAERILSGDLRRTPPDAAIEAYRLAALILARAEQLADAEQWLARAEDLAGTTFVNDRARFAVVRQDWQQALALLSEARDREAQGLLLEALHGRDGRSAVLEYQGKFAPADKIGGFTLPQVALWLGEEGRWGDAEQLLSAADDGHLEDNPALPFSRARLRIAMLTSPERRREFYLTGESLPEPSALRDDEEGQRLRVVAMADLELAERALTGVAPDEFATTIEANRLYLALGSPLPAVRAEAEQVLSPKLADFSSVLRYAWLALAFGVRFDAGPLKLQLEREEQLEGLSDSNLMTALQLAMRDHDLQEVLRLIERHRSAAQQGLPPEMGYGLEIEVLARQGRTEDARQRLADALPALGEPFAGRLDTIIREQEGGNPVALRLAAFERSGKEADLYFLVDALVDAQDERAGDYGRELWRLRRKVEDAITACSALFNASRDQELDDFLAELAPLPDHPRLAEHQAWADYRAGRLAEAQALVERLRLDEPDRDSLRQLAINVAVESGDWARLGPLIGEDLERRTERSSGQLMQAAGLADATRNPLAIDLARAAVAKDPDDPHVLLQAYGLALRHGREQEEEAGRWFRGAVERSGPNGPIQKGDVRQFIALREERDEQARSLGDLLLAGEIALTIIARPLGTTLSELLLRRLAENADLPARSRLYLPVIAGNRLGFDLTPCRSIALDPPAMMVLHLCGLLEVALTHLPQVIVPAGTMPLLLHDLQTGARIQRSRVEQGLAIKALIDSGAIRVLPMDTGDDETDKLYRHAVALDGRLVDSAPLYEPGSFAEKVRDPARFLDRLASPHGIVAALEAAGEITSDQAQAALSKLEGYGSDWPGTPPVDLTAPLIFDPVSLYALDSAGILQSLIGCGARIHLPETVVPLIRREAQEHERGSALDTKILEIRDVVAKALRDGRARRGPFRRDPKDEAEPFRSELETLPLMSLVQDSSRYDVLVSGDRMINTSGTLVDRQLVSKPVATPLDLIDHLLQSGAIDRTRWSRARQQLREAGIGLIPVQLDEVMEGVDGSNWAAGPGRLLRAIRGSVHLPVLRKGIRLPADQHWVGSTTLALVMAIRRCWTSLPNEEEAAAASTYLLETWPCLAAFAADDPVAAQQAHASTTGAHMLLAMPLDIPAARLSAYHDWFEQAVEPLLRGRDHQVTPTLVELARAHLTGSSGDETATAVSHDAGVTITAQEVRQHTLNFAAPFLRRALLEFTDVQQAIGRETFQLTVGGHSVSLAAAAAFYRAAYQGGASSLRSDKGELVASDGEGQPDGTVRAKVGDRWGVFREGGLFASDADVRTRSLERLLSSRTIAPDEANRWRALVLAEPITVELFAALMTLLAATPESLLEVLSGEEELRFGELVPDDPLYYRNLLPAGENRGLAGMVKAVTEARMQTGSASDAAVGLGPLAVWPDLDASAIACELGAAGALGASNRLVSLGDPYSVLFAGQLLTAHGEDPECLKALRSLISSVLDETSPFATAFALFCTGGTLALTRLDAPDQRVIGSIPRRRMTALIHAGYLTRLFLRQEIETEGLLERAQNWNHPAPDLANILDRAEARAWTRDRLRPDILHAQLAARLYAALQQLPEPLKTELTQPFEDYTQRLQDGGLAWFLLLRGPLDEFAAGYADPSPDPNLQLQASEERDGFVSQLVRATLFAPPAQTQDELLGAITSTVRQLAGEDRASILVQGVELAVRWGYGSLAEGLLTEALAADDRLGLRPVSLAHVALMAVASLPEEAREQALERHLGRVVFSNRNPAEARQLAGLVAALQDLRPEWVAALEPLRAACLLRA